MRKILPYEKPLVKLYEYAKTTDRLEVKQLKDITGKDLDWLRNTIEDGKVPYAMGGGRGKGRTFWIPIYPLVMFMTNGHGFPDWLKEEP